MVTARVHSGPPRRKAPMLEATVGDIFKRLEVPKRPSRSLLAETLKLVSDRREPGLFERYAFDNTAIHMFYYYSCPEGV